MTVMMGQDIGRQLCEALGLPKNTISFALRARVGQVVTVECEYAPEGNSFATELAEFFLLPRPRVETPPADSAETLGYDNWLQQRNERAHRELMAHSVGIDYGK